MEGHDLLNERHAWLRTFHVKQATYSATGGRHPFWIETDTSNIVSLLSDPTDQWLLYWIETLQDVPIEA